MCGGEGPVDVRRARRVTGVLVFTQWRDHTHVGCDRCTASAIKGHLGYSALLGWWSWIGIVLTPITLIEGMWRLFKPFPAHPSVDLVGLVRALLIAEQAEAAAAQHAAMAPQDRPLNLGGSWR